jgi:hypothetical protein
VKNQRHSAADAATGWDSRCAAVVRIGPAPRGWRSDTGVNWRYLKVEKANFQLNYCHGGTVLYMAGLDLGKEKISYKTQLSKFSVFRTER